MNNPVSTGPVLVGIDGSKAAISATAWAIEEATSSDVPLRLVHVTHIEEASLSQAEDFRLDVEYAEAALRGVRRSGVHRKAGESRYRRASGVGLRRRPPRRRVTRLLHDVCRIGGDRTGGQHGARVDRRRTGQTRTLPGSDHPQRRRRATVGDRLDRGRRRRRARQTMRLCTRQCSRRGKIP